MIRKTFLAGMLAILLPSGFLAAQNLLSDPECDNEKLTPSVQMVGDVTQGKLSHVVEDSTWNRCVKLELVRYSENENGKKFINYGIIFGGDTAGQGVSCKPDTLYKFSMEVKGKTQRAMIDFYEWDGLPTTYLNRIKARTSIHLIRPQKEWTVYKGTFKTSPTAKRVALGIQFWGDETRGDLPEKIGDYILVDKVSIEEASIGALEGKISAVPAQISPASVYVTPFPPEKTASEIPFFKDLLFDRPARLKTTASIETDAKGLRINIHCSGAKPKADYKGTADNAIWKDDLVEIFFDAVTADRLLNQFVVSAGGGRWMGDGSQKIADRYSDWQASTEILPDGWKCTVDIPFTTLGYKEPPKKGDFIRFNLCRQHPLEGVFEKLDISKANRIGGYTMFDNSSFSFTNGNNHDKASFGILFFGDMKPYMQKILADTASEKNNQEIAALMQKLDGSGPGESYAILEIIQKQYRILQLGKEKFIVAQVPPSSDVSIPFFPKELNESLQKIKIHAAVNEQIPVAVALANMGSVSAEYRVTVTSGWARVEPQHELWTDVPGLKTADGSNFPSQNIQIRRGIASKDSDAENHGQRYDILAKLNEASTVPVPPKEAGLLWINFDCRGVKPGTYSGTLQVTPLDEPFESFKHTGAGYSIQDQSKQIPIELEVLPFALPEVSPMPFNGYRTCMSAYQADFMKDYDCFMYMVTPYYFTFEFNPDGSVKTNRVREFLKPQLALLGKELKDIKTEPKLMVGYSNYDIFKRIIIPKNIPFDSEAYWNAWRNWCKGVDSLLNEYGFRTGEYTMELFDEPDLKKVTIEEFVRVHKEAKEAVPGVRLMVTSGIAFFDAGKELVDDWVFYFARTQLPDYRAKIDAFHQMPGKHVSLYACGTSMRQALYRYYRLLPWQALEIRGDSVSLYQFFGGLPGLDFRKAPLGDLAYVTPSEMIPSIRLENFRIGQTDVKYMKLLESLAQGDSQIAKEARAFLATATRDVAVVYPHDSNKADEVRQKASDYILKLKK